MTDTATSARADVLAEEHRLIAAGFGGQGVLTIGKLLCNAAMAEGRRVCYLPSYGAEVRGGTANCKVVVSSRDIYSPLVECADSLVMLNEPSMERFLPRLAPGGRVVANTSAVDLSRFDLPEAARVTEVPAIGAAAELGEVRVANVVMLGALVAATGLVGREACESAIRQVLGGRKAALLQANLAALARGMELAGA
jgi:2-oxoglutarate ferredoxin oxidoreductase subunit gamma